MNTNLIIGVIAAVVVIGGGAWYMSTKAPGDTKEGTEVSTEGAGSATFAEFIAMGGSRECDVTVDNEHAPATGVVFVSGADVRSDFVTRPTTAGGSEITAHMLRTNGYVYTWTDAMPQGVKIKETATMQSGEEGQSQGVSMESKVDYDCRPWTPDASKFSVPANITFMDFSAGMMPAGIPQPN